MKLQEIEEKFNIRIGQIPVVEEALMDIFGNINYRKYPKDWTKREYVYTCETDEGYSGNEIITRKQYRTRKEALEGLLLENIHNNKIKEIVNTL